MDESGRFTVKQQVLLSEEQEAFLRTEVARRKTVGSSSDVEAATGGNRNVNKGMLIREALEVHFQITQPQQTPTAA